MKRIWKDYFSFSRKERWAVLALLLLMTAFIIAPYLYDPPGALPEADQDLAAYLASVTQPEGRSDSAGASSFAARKPPALFRFDPNTLSVDGWQQLGVPVKTANTILRYVAKGGKFRKPEDIRKIWGMPPQLAETLLPYIRLTGTINGAAPDKGYSPAVKERNVPVIDINTASTEAWKSLPGIGNVLAARITRFRDRIGGFSSVEQVKKTYGITDSLFEKIAPLLRFDAGTLPAVNINTASAYELRSKLGLSYAAAAAITRYRDQHGPYPSVGDVARLAGLADSVGQKLLLRGRTE